MHFCEVCNNMYYTNYANNKLSYYCRYCGNTNDQLSGNKVVVLKTQLKKTAQDFSNVINRYTKTDPTLPRINTVLCPNEECSTNAADHPTPREIIYMRYDNVGMKYVYMCSTCDTVWKPEEAH